MEIIVLITAIVLNVILIAAMLAFSLAALLDIAGFATTGVPFVPLPFEFVREVVDLVPAGKGVFYDLGSGNGHVVAAVARAYPDMRAVGIEKAPFPALVTTIMRRKYPENAEFIFKDFYSVSLTDATYVFLYLFPKIAKALEPKLVRELKAGARVVACDFPLGERVPTRTKKVEYGKRSHTFYVYDF